MRKSKRIIIFLSKSKILKFIRPKPDNVSYCHDRKGIGLITSLCLGLRHLREHKFKHSFQDCLNPLLPALLIPAKEGPFWKKSKYSM